MPSYPTILKIIKSFYDTAKKDILIGYHFRVISDFDEHIPRIADFWNLQLNGQLENRDHLPFDLVNVHRPLKINSGELDRWVLLFKHNLEQYISTGEISPEQANSWMEKVDRFRIKLKGFLGI